MYFYSINWLGLLFAFGLAYPVSWSYPWQAIPYVAVLSFIPTPGQAESMEAGFAPLFGPIWWRC